MVVIANVLFTILVIDRWTFNSAYKPSGYLGCYIDKWDRILSHRLPDSSSNTGDQCKQRCKVAGYRYAGTEYTNECFCGNSIKNYPKGPGCTATCPGNAIERCGGTWYISLYSTKDNEIHVPSGYLGCYIDKGDRILSHRLPDSTSNTGDQCKQNCKRAGYILAGTEYSKECFCGNRMKNYPKASGCTTKCPGNERERCGGTWYISIYSTMDSEDFCAVLKEACPPTWKCENRKYGYYCRSPLMDDVSK